MDEGTKREVRKGEEKFGAICDDSVGARLHPRSGAGGRVPRDQNINWYKHDP